tara:strand:+ start:1333 stop:3234 length:1902 start_codon:yes stop_codon:yes gene_type:complete
MSNSNNIWDIKNSYNQRRANTWSRGSNRSWTAGGNTPGNTAVVDVVSILSTGNAVDFGDLATHVGNAAGMAANSTRGFTMAGEAAPAYYQKITAMTLASGGVSSEYGNMTQTGGARYSHNNNTRALTFGAYTPVTPSPYMSNTIDSMTMASAGNVVDFGDMAQARVNGCGYGNSTKAFSAGGSTNPSNSGYSNAIEVVTIASTGNSVDYADLAEETIGNSGCSSTTSGYVMTGSTGSGNTATVLHNDLSSGGAGSEFGDLSQARDRSTGTDNSVIGVNSGGRTPSSVNTIDFFTMATTGNGSDFGDLTQARFYSAGFDDSNSGLDYSDIQRPSVNYMPGSGRVLMLGGNRAGGDRNTIDTYNINTFGNSFDFGDLVQITDHNGGCASLTRAFSMGGVNSSTTIIQAVQFANQGNAFDFGDLTIGSDVCASLNSTTRGINAAGYAAPGVYSNIIDYITMATAGNASDFGDLTVARADSAPMASSTRGIFAGGEDASNRKNTIDYITIASTGNATDFGDTIGTVAEAGGLSSGVRGVMGGGSAPSPSVINVMAYVTIASTGNMTDFGDLTAAAAEVEGSSTPVRGCFMGGRTPSIINTIQYITIASTGNAIDFGDMSEGSSDFAAASDSNGGLQA